MRNAFVKELNALAAADPRVVLLSGDIGNRLFDGFKASFPNRFYNCGVAEANMMSVAAGMALCGLRPICYTITPFTTVRCLDQIRVDVCYHNLPVIIAGVGSGLSYAELGPTHHSCEDIALLRALPNMTVLCPADVHETKGAMRAALKHDGPVYLRMGKKGEPLVHEKEPVFEIGKGIVLRQGGDVALVGTGTIMPEVIKAADRMGAQGISAHVVSFPSVKPLDLKLLEAIFKEFPLVVTVEEHSLIGGLGGAVAEWLAAGPAMKARLCVIAVADEFFAQAGDQETARQYFGLTADAIVTKVMNQVKQKRA
jgi:transketolase